MALATGMVTLFFTDIEGTTSPQDPGDRLHSRIASGLSVIPA
jgi:hypothetical protein